MKKDKTKHNKYVQKNISIMPFFLIKYNDYKITLKEDKNRTEVSKVSLQIKSNIGQKTYKEK